MPLSNKNSIADRLQALADEGRSSTRVLSQQRAPADYDQLSQQLAALISGEKDRVANLANCAALLWQGMPAINWVGFYLLKRNTLVLGPFQGKPACTRIEIGHGVCGLAAEIFKTVIVGNVREFPGHIACDLNSRSEIVLPIIIDGKFIGLLDIDSPEVDRFNHVDQQGLEGIIQILIAQI